MNIWPQLVRLFASIASLGARRLTTLAIIGVGVTALTIFAGYYLSRPVSETLYSGLARDDVASIGAALKEVGISFDVNAEGTAVLVGVNDAAQARMMLATKGLPHGGNVGDELYDKLGSLGLTSFMQDVTRVRAIEGELARTIQMLHAVKAARVHIVMSDQGTFRREPQAPSASVVIRTDGADDRATGEAIRHLVASAVPNMKPEEVTVLNVDGRLIAAGSDSLDKSPGNLLALEKSVSEDVRGKITQTLAPYLNVKNFEVSVAARLNADKQQTAETTFDPASRIERSVHISKEKQSSQNSAGQQAASVQANLPKTGADAESKASRDDDTKRDETTNYEISSKSVTTTSVGFRVESLHVAVLLNRSALVASLGANPPADALDKQVGEIEQIVASAAGVKKDRGDVVKVSVVDFVDSSKELDAVPGPSFVELLLRQSGALINSLTVILVATLGILFGVRPAVRGLLSAPAPDASGASNGASRALPAPTAQVAEPAPALIEKKSDDEQDTFLEELDAQKSKSPQQLFQRLVDYDEERAVAILARWIQEGAGA